jgi:hypothetical protein
VNLGRILPLFMYGYEGDCFCHDAEFVEIFGSWRKFGFRTPSIGAVSNRANTMLTCSWVWKKRCYKGSPEEMEDEDGRRGVGVRLRGLIGLGGNRIVWCPVVMYSLSLTQFDLSLIITNPD